MISLLFLCFLPRVVAGSPELRTVNNTCPPDLLITTEHKFLQVHDGLCFRFILDENQSKNYPDARADCTKGGGTLVMPQTQSLSDFLVDQLINNYGKFGEVWIGLHREKAGEKFVWEDGGNIDWHNFDETYNPKSRWFGMAMDDCIAIDTKHGGSWFDFMCKGDALSWIARADHTKAYICQYDAVGLPASSVDRPKHQDTQTVSRTIDNSCPLELLKTTNRSYLQVHDDSCFHFVFNQDKSYIEAHKDCIENGGTLALPKKISTNDYLTNQLLNHYNKSDEIWIGLRYNKVKEAYTWEDGSELKWRNFADGHGPSTGWFDVGGCTVLDPKTGGLWYDEECKQDLLSLVLKFDYKKAYVCQFKPEGDKQDPTKTVTNTCPPSLVTPAKRYYLQVWGSFCFRFVLNNPLIYKEANKDCQVDGGTLALVKTRDLNDFITDRLLNYYRKFDKTWIGLHDLKEEGQFFWEDGTELGWSNFAAGQGPENTWLAMGIEDCVALDPQEQGRWHDFQCDHNFLSWLSRPDPRKIYVCQYPSVDGG